MARCNAFLQQQDTCTCTNMASINVDVLIACSRISSFPEENVHALQGHALQSLGMWGHHWVLMTASAQQRCVKLLAAFLTMV